MHLVDHICIPNKKLLNSYVIDHICTHNKKIIEFSPCRSHMYS
jgi:hypothetical protein